MAEFEQSFSFACPKFLSPVPPNYDTIMMNFHKVMFGITAVTSETLNFHIPVKHINYAQHKHVCLEYIIIQWLSFSICVWWMKVMQQFYNIFQTDIRFC